MNIGKETEQVEFKTRLAEQRQDFESVSSILNKHQSGTLSSGSTISFNLDLPFLEKMSMDMSK